LSSMIDVWRCRAGLIDTVIELWISSIFTAETFQESLNLELIILAVALVYAHVVCRHARDHEKFLLTTGWAWPPGSPNRFADSIRELTR
jgi:hypothetical protein